MISGSVEWLIEATKSIDSAPHLQQGVTDTEFATRKKNPSAIITFKAYLFMWFGRFLFLN